MVKALVPVNDARKGRMQWLARGMASHATRIYAGSVGRNATVAVCGFPRSGTSWISAVLAAYYDLPVPRHYVVPQFRPHVMHGHDLRLGRLGRVFYMVRSPFDLYPSLFVKRFGVSDPTGSSRDQFAAFLKAELAYPHEAPCPWPDHVARACRQFGPPLVYTRDVHRMSDQLTSRIQRTDGSCDRERVLRLVSARPKGAGAPTTVTPQLARKFDWFTTDSRRLVEAQLDRLQELLPTGGMPKDWVEELKR